jgi:DNA repair exonuclease SbcCD ATPase subunit
MANRILTPPELAIANRLLDRIRAELQEISRGDNQLLFAYRRKLYKELTYDERGKPMQRRRLKQKKYHEQGGVCPICGKMLPKTYAVLDRLTASEGYTAENTRLIHRECDAQIQAARGYS